RRLGKAQRAQQPVAMLGTLRFAQPTSLRHCENLPAPKISVIPAQAGIQFVGLTALKVNQMHKLDSRRSLPSTPIGGGNDGVFFRRFRKIHSAVGWAKRSVPNNPSPCWARFALPNLRHWARAEPALASPGP
ncbi:MAG: hypothetical protein KKG92_08080, partial [Gammaproteobacteria bacterium]|nr:hypothetical protein [Gammaproteobacteria bacterium]